VNNASDSFDEKSELMLGKADRDLTNMSAADIQALVHELQACNMELKLRNERLKNSQQEFLASRNYYLHIFNSSPIAYLTLNADGVIQKANLAAGRLLGIGVDGLLNKKFDQFITAIDQGSYYFFIRDILANHRDKVIKLKVNCLNDKIIFHDCQQLKYCDCSPEACIHNDNFIYAECHGLYSVTEEGGGVICLSIFNITETAKRHEVIACLNERLEQKVFQQTNALTDINEELTKKIVQLKSYKRQIIEREEKLNSIFNAAVEGIITIYISGAIVSMNKAVENIFGYSQEELIGCNINKLIPLSRPKYRVPYQNNVLGVGFSSMIGKIKEVTGVRKDNSTVPLDISIAKFSIDGTSYLTCIVRDVSLRKLQEQRDQEHLDELAYVTRLGLMGEMASGIAHEVNQPLTAITSYSQVCLNLMQSDNYDPVMLRDILHKTNQQALKAGHIIHRMRDFVKGKKLQRSTIDINDLIYDAVGLCESYLKQNSVQLGLQLKKRLPPICADSIQIEQVILNLIRNSIDALSSLPRLMSRSLSIQTAINCDNDIEIRIKDNGPGIDVAEQKKILTPFFTTKSDGMGMGLSICRSIIEAHDGALRFNSQPGKGTTFYFTLPMRRKADVF
jgi:PAS domain S-box-containing protein